MAIDDLRQEQVASGETYYQSDKVQGSSGLEPLCHVKDVFEDVHIVMFYGVILGGLDILEVLEILEILDYLEWYFLILPPSKGGSGRVLILSPAPPLA